MRNKFVNLIKSKFARPSLLLICVCVLVGYKNYPIDSKKSSGTPAKYKSPSKNRKFPLKNLKTKWVRINGNNVQIYIVDNDETRTEGLMYVQDNELKINQAMLFVYPVSTYLSFYMRNTYIPLDIAFITSDGYVINVDRMNPHSLHSHWSRGPVKYALEMKKGAFSRFGIVPGVHIKDIVGLSTRI